MALERQEATHGSYQKRIWKLIGYLGRYGHQPADVSLRLPVDDLMRLADAVGDLLTKEAEAMKPRGG